MSLNWNVGEIPEETRTIVATEDDRMSGVKKGDRLMSPITNALIWSTMGVGIGVIDDDTADEFAARLEIWQKLNGALLTAWEDDGNGGVKPVPRPLLTKDDVVAHKGLSTNVFPMESRAAWIKRVVSQSDPFQGVAEPTYR